ncbi:hypothetical protein FOZ62_025842, partial [Perkinsus olseni]
MAPPSQRKRRHRGRRQEAAENEVEFLPSSIRSMYGDKDLVTGGPYQPRQGEKSCFEDMPVDANDYLKRVIHQRSSGPQATSVVLSEREDDDDDEGYSTAESIIRLVNALSFYVLMTSYDNIGRRLLPGSGSISSFASFTCIETPIVHSEYRSGVRDSEEVEVWLTEFRNLRERLAASMDEEEEARKRVIFRAPGSSTSSPTVWSSAYFAEMGPPTEDVVAEIDSAAAVVALETVAKGIEKTARVSRRSRHRSCRSAPEGRGSDLTFVQWCVWCYALMLRIQHPLSASTASDMQSILASLQRYVLCPQPSPCEDPPEYNEWAVRHGRLGIAARVVGYLRSDLVPPDFISDSSGVFCCIMCPFRAFCLFVAALGAAGITWFTMNKFNLVGSSSSQAEGTEDEAKPAAAAAVAEESLYRALAKRMGIALLIAFHCDLILRLGYTQCNNDTLDLLAVKTAAEVLRNSALFSAKQTPLDSTAMSSTPTSSLGSKKPGSKITFDDEGERQQQQQAPPPPSVTLPDSCFSPPASGGVAPPSLVSYPQSSNRLLSPSLRRRPSSGSIVHDLMSPQ